MLRANTLGSDQCWVDRAEDVFTGGVQLLDTLAEGCAVLFHAATNNLVGAAF